MWPDRAKGLFHWKFRKRREETQIVLKFPVRKIFCVSSFPLNSGKCCSTGNFCELKLGFYIEWKVPFKNVGEEKTWAILGFPVMVGMSQFRASWYSSSFRTGSQRGQTEKDRRVCLSNQISGFQCLRACLLGGGGPQVGGVTPLSIKSLIFIWFYQKVKR